jgi:hypothetical protein
MKMDLQYTSTYCAKNSYVVSCDYNEKTGTAEKILVLMSILEKFPNFGLNLAST